MNGQTFKSHHRHVEQAFSNQQNNKVHLAVYLLEEKSSKAISETSLLILCRNFYSHNSETPHGAQN